MLVRTEFIRNSSNLLVVDELDKYLGEITQSDFIEAMEDRDSIKIDDYIFYHVDKFLLFHSFLPKNKQQIK